MDNLNVSSLSDFKGRGKAVLRQTGLFFYRQNHWVRLGVFLLFAGYCFYFLYSHLYYSQWSEEKKMEYINTKEREVVFDTDRFKSVLSQVEKRKENYASGNVQVPDVFRLDSPAESSR